MNAQEPNDEHREVVRRALRRATLYSYGLFAAAVIVAVAGAALVAWILSRLGFPFLLTWLILAAVMLIIPLIAVAVGAVRERGRPGGGPGT